MSDATIVLVHGAWADGASWTEVIRPLQEQGYRVIAAPIPLTSLSDDVRAVNRVLRRTTGTLVLAAHAYAGAVISACDGPRVKSLVYIEALTPAEAFGSAFAQNASAEQIQLFVATQRPIMVACIQEQAP